MKNIIFLFISILATVSNVYSQSDTDTTVYKQEEVDKQAEFPGGKDRMEEYFNFRFKTRQASRPVKEGPVIFKLIIEKNGRVSDVQIVQGLESRFDQELLTLITDMPKWQAAILKGKAVRSSMVLTRSFKY